MGTGYLIDSNVVIDYLNGNLPDTGRLFLHPIINETPNLSVIVKIEVLGFNYDQDSNHLVFDFLQNANVFELTKEIVDTTIQIRKQNKIKIPDAIIAATALVFDFILVTRNSADFKNVVGLKILNPWLIKTK